MSINYDASLIGVNTPSAITGVIANRPAATNVSEGTFFISTDTQEIFSAKAGAWVLVSGGGGGSQNLAQVLNVGNNANGQEIFLNTNLYSRIKADNTNASFSLINFGNGPLQSGIGFDIQQNTLVLQRHIRSQTQFDYDEYEYESTASKHTIKINSDYLNANGHQSSNVIECKAGSINRQTLRSDDTNFGTFSQIEIIAENLHPANDSKIILQKLDTSGNNSKIEINASSEFITISKTSSSRGNTLQMSQSQTGGTTQVLPDWNGILAQVNEKIVAQNIDLSAGNFFANEYGVYVVSVGDNTNFFELDGFVNAGTDGQFVTICAGDVPVRCFNSAGNIFGTANINSKGLYKLMKIGNDIYSSHI